MQNQIAEILCKKNRSLTCDECYKNKKDKNNICKRSNNCRISEKTENQLQYILSSIDEDTLLEACPGGGKTEVVGIKSAYEIRRFDKNSKIGIAILTFTNEASDVIKKRVYQFSEIGSLYPHFIGTLSSFFHQYIAQPFGYHEIDYLGMNGDFSLKIIDNDLNAYTNHWLQKYKCSIPYISKNGKRITIFAHQIFYDEKKEDFYIKFDKIIFSVTDFYQSRQMQKHIKDNRKKYNNPNYYDKNYFYNEFYKCKNNFNKDGFVTYEDMNCIAYQILDINKIAERIATRFPLIIVDECQDLSWIEIQILNKLNKKGSILHFVGDINQSIFEFKEINPDSNYILKFTKNFKKFELIHNFRSCQPIVNLSSKLVEINKGIGVEKNKFLEKSVLYLEYETPEEVVDKYLKILKYFKISEDKSCVIVKQNILKDQLLGNKNNSEMHLLISAIQFWEKGTSYLKKKSMEYAGRQISKWFGGAKNKSSYYCPKDISSAFAWRIFLKNILNECSINCKLINHDRKYGKWYSDARKELPSIIKKNYFEIRDYDNVIRDFDEFFSSRWYVGKEVEEDIIKINSNLKNNSLIKISTVHGSKGCTYDSTLLISSKTAKSESGRWKSHWLEGTDEDKRVGYVASTRAKFLMIWAIPTLNKKDKELIENYGFKDGNNII